ncbi:extracellular solute-binding protein [Marinomonas mediterranea]|uniref:ABC transporter substrate-binding protein n=1 Tax=Marinomonas mediterranea TaxID=119864 RepID=UPI0023495DC2|nr:ABC transporter substrate-binding protein [Marinomonas mediterranea]WCN12546.1 extracellular solute-binding protein [Marinomonas mediterranea]
MKSSSVTRRQFIKTSALLANCAWIPNLSAEEARLRFNWWGGKNRADLTNRVIESYVARQSSVQIEGRHFDWLDHWQTFISDVALGQAADIIQMDLRYLKLYADNGVLMPLDAYLDNGLNLSSFGDANVDSCRINGKLYGVNLGINSAATVVSTSKWNELELDSPGFDMTWDELIAHSELFAKRRNNSNLYAMTDGSGLAVLLNNWLRQRNRALYNESGELAFDASDIAEWFAMWAHIRGVKGCVPPDLQVLDKHSMETSLLVMGYSTLDFAHSNMLVNYQKHIDDNLDLRPFPIILNGTPGHYYKPSQMLSVTANSYAPQEAVDFINYFVTNLKAAEILGFDRGISASSDVRTYLEPSLDEIGLKTVTYIDKLKPYVGGLPATPPEQAGEVAIQLQNISHEVAFNHISVKEGAERFYKKSLKAINKG